MGVNKPRWKYLLQEEGDHFHIQLEDGNGLFDNQGNAKILLEQGQQSIGCNPSPLLASVPLFLVSDLMGSILMLEI